MEAVQAGWPDIGLEEHRQFDFWLGEWDLGWGDGQTATNSIYLDFDGRVVVENFDGRPSIELQGMSVSTYDVEEGCWRQTWVDNTGTYLAFKGGFADGQMELRTERRLAGVEALFRMRWFDIRPDALQWAWERSDDGGKAWRPLWEIAYTRVV